MNEQIKELVKEAGGDFWQRIESDRTLNKEAYITFDPPQLLEKFVELIVKECVGIVSKRKNQAIDDGWNVDEAMSMAEMDLEEHFGVK